MRKEIEVKARIQDLDIIKQKLVALGCVFTEPVTQHDTIFVDSNYGAFDEFQPDKNLLRIRESNGKYIFTIKQPKSNEQDALEHETEISDPKEMREAILLMGYHEEARVHKTRQKSRYQNWEICLDQVEGLGAFIEVEEITDQDAVEEIQNKLFEFVQTLGVLPEDRVTQGYDTMVYIKNKNL